MKNIIKLFTLILFFAVNLSSAQTTMKSVNEAKKIELNKKEFIGKPLSYLLSNINIPIKSVRPVPNKNSHEINRINFLFIPYKEYRNDARDITNKPTTITIVFNQNWNLEGNRCTYMTPSCTEWTKEDEKNLGSLIIYDIYVLGKN